QLTKGVRTTFGTAASGDFVPEFDTALVKKLRAAGAILVGKTNTPEFGLLPTTEPLRFGPTHNPWDRSRTAGGSSGGSAAAVAAVRGCRRARPREVANRAHHDRAERRRGAPRVRGRRRAGRPLARVARPRGRGGSAALGRRGLPRHVHRHLDCRARYVGG